MAEQEKVIESAVSQASEPKTQVTTSTQTQGTTEILATTAASSTVPETKSPTTTTEVIGGLDLSKLPEEHRNIVRDWADKREKDQLRYLTKKSEEYQTAAKKAQYYDDYVNSQEYGAFKQWLTNRSQTSQSVGTQNVQPPVSVDPREFTYLGYTEEESQKLANTIERQIEAKLNQRLEIERKQFVSELNRVHVDTQQTKARQELEALAQVHPDIYDLVQNGIMKMAVNDVVINQGGTLEQAYAKAKDIESFYADKARQRMQADIKTKQEAITAKPTPSGDTEIIYVDDPRKLTDTAARYASQGKKVKVMIKRS